MDRELQIKLERINNILITSLQRQYKEVFKETLSVQEIESAFVGKLAEAKKKMVEEVFNHLTNEDLILAKDHVFPSFVKPLVVEKAPVIEVKKNKR